MKIIGIDFGDSRTGVAGSDALGLMAHSIGVIFSKDLREVAKKVTECVSQTGAGKVVVGLPLNMDGTCGERVERTELFVAELEKLINIPIIMQDERLTTVSATRVLNETNVRGQKRKQRIDAVAATILLQGYLDREAVV